MGNRGFLTIDEAVSYARLLNIYQAIYEKNGRFYAVKKSDVPKGVKILVSVDQMNKEIVNYYE